MKIQVVLSGYGTVGREFIKLLNEKYSYIYETYGIQLVVSGVLGEISQYIMKTAYHFIIY